MTRSRRAFTLLEVILALGIMAVLAVSLFSSLHGAFKSKRTAEASLDNVRTAEATMELVRGELESALAPRGTLAGAFRAESWVTGDGFEDDVVSFFTDAPMPPSVYSPNEFKRIELTVLQLEGSGERCLFRRVTGNLLSPIATDPSDEILCRGVRGFGLRFYDGYLWADEWDSSYSNDSLPIAVEVTLTLDPPQSRIDAGDTSPIQLIRIIHLPCTGEGEPRPLGEDGTGSDTSGGTGTGTGSGDASGDATGGGVQ